MKLSNRQKVVMSITLLSGSFITAFSETLMNNALIGFGLVFKLKNKSKIEI